MPMNIIIFTCSYFFMRATFYIFEHEYASSEKNSQKLGMSPWWPLLGLWCYSGALSLKSRHCNSFEDRAPVDEIYGCPIFK